MTFRRPDEIIGNHIAKYQAMKLAKMLMAYDFERQLNPLSSWAVFCSPSSATACPAPARPR